MTESSSLLTHPRALDWFDAASVRRSRRTFDTLPAPTEQLGALADCCADFRPLDGARVELVREPSIDVFRGVIGSYGKVTGAPHILVVIASRDVFAQQHAGYLGEACILEATRLGLDTCWVGGFFNRRRVDALVALGSDEHAVAVSPVGHALSAHSGTERTMERVAGSHSRKPLDEIAPGSTEWPGWARAAVECARIAPSATNRQPWRFDLEEGALVISRSHGPELPKVTKRLDCGIAMLHAELGALSQGVRGTWHECAEGREVARFEPFTRESL